METTFQMKFTIYTKKDCPHCYRAKTAIELCGHELDVVTLDEDFNKLEFFDKFGQGSTFPQVTVMTPENVEYVGGCSDTIKYLKNLSLV